MTIKITERSGDFTLRLRDGRQLQVLSVGKEDGFPLFHFHGNGSSRLELFTVQSIAENLGVRVICPDRPGVGGSDPRPGYHLLDWPDDVVEVADQLGIERFAVEGFSGGAPFALACAYKIPHRLTACGMISPAIDPDAPSFVLRSKIWILAHFPELFCALVRLSMRLSGSDEASIEKGLMKAKTRLGEGDSQLLDNEFIKNIFVQSSVDSLRHGLDAVNRDALVYARPRGFQLKEIPFEHLFLWQGEQDSVTPAAGARMFVEALPHCTATFYPDRGHLSTFVNHAQDIWKTLGVTSASE